MSKLLKNPINIFILLSLIISVFFYINFDKGFELTDESYLLLISLFPNEVIGKVNNSGIIGNLILELVNYNLFYFRVVGAILLLTFSLLLIKPIIQFNDKVIFLKNIKKSNLILLFLLGTINYYQNWVITPSYDLYNLVGILIFFNGLLKLKININKKYEFFFSILLILFGGLLTFICKPTTTVFLITIFFIWSIYFLNLKEFFLVILISSVLSFLILSIYINIFYSNWYLFIKDIFLGIELKTILDPRYSIFDNFLSTTKQIIYYYYINYIYFIFFLLGIIFFKLIKKKNFNDFLFLLIFTPLFLENHFLLSLIFLVIFYILFDIHLSNIFKIEKKEIDFFILNFILIFLLYAYVVGTNTNVVILLKKSSIIIFLIVFNFVQKLRFDRVFFFQKINLFFTILFIFSIINIYFNFEKPRRYYADISDQNMKVKLNRFNGFIYVDKIIFDFINDFTNILEANGWNKNNYLIDLTGRTPGLNVISGAKFISDPWWASAYVGSQKKVEKLLKISDINKIKNSWIVTTDFKVRINPEVLNTVGLDLDRDFQFVGKVEKSNKNYFVWMPTNNTR